MCGYGRVGDRASPGALIGTVQNVGGGKYQLQVSWPTNPINVIVHSSLGGSASLAVTPT